MRSLLLSLLAALALTACASGPAVSKSGDDASAPAEPIAPKLWDLPELRGASKGYLALAHEGGLQTKIRFRTEERYVEWSTRKAVDDETVGFASERELVSFAPTETALVGADTLFIAGYSDRGHSIIEAWTLTQPTAKAEGESVQVVPPSVQRKTRVYDDELPGERFVSGITEIYGSGGRELLVQFANTGNIYRLNTETGARSIVVSRTEGAPFVVPGLRAFSFVATDHHLDRGYVYTFMDAEIGEDGALSGCFLFDETLDGEIDDAWPLTSLAEWQASSLWNGDLYAD